MSFLKRLLGATPRTLPLPPLEHARLGRLVWDEDCECWVGKILVGSMTHRLRIGAGFEHEYPPAALLDRMALPSGDLKNISVRAFEYLRDHGNLDVWKVRPEDLTLEGLDANDRFGDRRYTVVFTDPDENIWSVHFEDGNPTDCGVDD